MNQLPKEVVAAIDKMVATGQMHNSDRTVAKAILIAAESRIRLDDLKAQDIARMTKILVDVGLLREEENPLGTVSLVPAYRHLVTGEAKPVTIPATDVANRIEQYRKVFADPTTGLALKPGSKGDKQSCIRKMRAWMKANPEYSWEDIMETAEFYVSKEKRNQNCRYLQRADYFIMKSGESRLSALIDDVIASRPAKGSKPGRHEI